MAGFCFPTIKVGYCLLSEYLCHTSSIATRNANGERKMTKHFNTDDFEAWLKAQGRKWYHMNTKEQIAAIKEFKEQAK